MKTKIAVNSFVSVSAHFIRMAISLFMTPYLLSRLGKEVYGILPLVNSIIAFLTIASGGIQSSVGRYASLNFAGGHEDKANRYINTAFFLLAGLFSLILIPFVIATICLPSLLNLPQGHELEAQIVFGVLGVNLILLMLTSPFQIGIYFKQRFDIRGAISITGQLIYVTVIIGVFFFFEPNIMYVSFALLFNTLISVFISIVISKRLVPSLKFSPSLFDKSKLKEIGSYSFWTLIIQATVLIFLNTDYIIINKCIGSSAVTNYSLVARFNELMRAVITAAVRVVMPLFTQLEAKNDFGLIRSIYRKGVRGTLLLIIPPSFLLCIFSNELLLTWVGPGYHGVDTLFWIVLLPQVLILGAMPANVMLGGLGKVKWVGIVNSVCACFNLALSLVLVIYFDMGVIGVALASSLILSLKNFFFMPLYSSHCIKMPTLDYYKAFLRPLAAGVPMIFLAFYIQNNFDITGWVKLLSSSALCTVLFGITAYLIAFETSDRDDCKEFLTRVVLWFKKIV